MELELDSALVQQIAYQGAAKRLHRALRRDCDSAADFPRRLSAALRCALDLFAAEPGLAHLLLLGPTQSSALAEPGWRLSSTCAGLLEQAATDADGLIDHPCPIEPFLVAGIAAQLAAALALDKPPTAQIDRLLEFLLPYYLPPERAAVAIVAARNGADGSGS